MIKPCRCMKTAAVITSLKYEACAGGGGVFVSTIHFLRQRSLQMNETRPDLEHEWFPAEEAFYIRSDFPGQRLMINEISWWFISPFGFSSAQININKLMLFVSQIQNK